MFDPENQARIDMLEGKRTYEELEREVHQLRVEKATLKYALRHIYTRVEAAREAFSDDVLELMGYKRKEEH